MGFRTLDITVLSAEGLKNVNLFMKMGVYVVVSLINGESISSRKTHTSSGGCNPKWSHRIKFTVEESSINQASLLFVLKCSRVLGNRDIGEVSIPIRELQDASGADTLDSTTPNAPEHVVNYQVRTLSGKCKGTFTFSYKFGEICPQEPESVSNPKKNKESETCNEPPQPHSGILYAIPPYPQATYPPPGGYGAYPSQYGYAGWYPNPQSGSYGGYPPLGQGLGYQQVMEQPVKEKAKSCGGAVDCNIALE